MVVDRHEPPYKVAGAVLLVIVAAFGVLLSLQFRGVFRSHTDLTVVSPRAGLVVDPGSKVTLNGWRSVGWRAFPPSTGTAPNRPR